MRSSKSRSRNKSNRQRSLGNIINRVFDSSGPESKVRGTPQQIIDKYLMLARDAQLSNDRVAEQAFLQHAEHYTRMLGEAMREMAREQEGRQSQQPQNSGGNGNGGYGDRAERTERYEPRTQREGDDDQPYFAPLGVVETHERESELVETPEMRLDTQPAAFEGHLPDFLGSTPVPTEARPPRTDRRPRGGQAATTSAPGGQDKPERGPRGPRRPKPEATVAPGPPEGNDSE